MHDGMNRKDQVVSRNPGDPQSVEMKPLNSCFGSLFPKLGEQPRDKCLAYVTTYRVSCVDYPLD